MAYWPWLGWRPRVSLGEYVHEWRFFFTLLFMTVFIAFAATFVFAFR